MYCNEVEEVGVSLGFGLRRWRVGERCGLRTGSTLNVRFDRNYEYWIQSK